MLRDDSIVTRIAVRRNQSLSLAGFVGFVATGFAVHFALALFAGIQGWWPVVGFIVGAFFLLCGTVFAVMRAAGVREVLTVTPESIVVEFGRGRAEYRVELDRYWARIERSADRRRLVLRSRGVALEIGRTLSGPERDALARRLVELIGPRARLTDAGAPSALTV